uniref:Uncharacterized protein n=1 Tax=Sinocyclocheilus anshuiensis TaxID=1608454 RepID=A0A671P4Q8_9TELE
MKCKLMKAEKKIHKELTFSCQTNRRGERISLTTYLMIITCLMHLILQAQAVANSSQTSRESTFQPSVESSSGFDLIQEEQKISRQNRHIVNDNHNIGYKKKSNSNILWEKAEENNWYKWVKYTAEEEKWGNCIVCFEARPILYIVPIPIHNCSCRIFNDEWFKKCPGLSSAMGLDVVKLEGKCFIKRGREINTFRNCTQKIAFCPYWCQFLQSTTGYREATELQCIRTRKWPIEATNEEKIRSKRFKARDEVKAGFESIFIWITQNKNTEWINYIYYNQQGFNNYTDEALSLLGDQLDATSRMTWQNRIALDYLLAKKGGVCVMFEDQCCTYIPNNTAAEGAFSEVMIKLKNLRMEVKANDGKDNQIWDWFDLRLGAWGAWLAKSGMFLGVAILIGGLLFCCVLPLLRSLVIKATVKQMKMLRCQYDEKLIVEGNQNVRCQDWPYKPDWESQTLTNDGDSSTSNEDEEEV